MAKVVDKKEKKAKVPEFKDTIYGIVGQSLADNLGSEVYRIKVESMPECILVTESGVDYTISITQKKQNVDYDTDHIKDTFTPKSEIGETDETDETDDEN